MKKTTLAAVLCLMALSVTACSNFLSRTELTRNIIYTDTGVNEPDVFPVLRASGHALISVQRGPTPNQKMLQAMRASKLEAYKKLSEQVYGIYIDARDSASNSIHRQDKLESQVNGMVRGARVIRQYPVGDTYVTELELDSKVIYEMYQMRNAF